MRLAGEANLTFDGTTLKATGDLCATVKVVAPALCIGSEYVLPTADGSAGQIMCTDGSGALAFATAAAGVTLAGSTNNTIATVTGANALAGEAELTFDGTDLAIGNTAPSTYMDSVHGLIIGDTSDATSEITIATTTSGVGGLNFTDTADTTNQASLQHFASSGDLRLNAQSSHSIQVGGTDAVYIDSSRRVGMGTSAPAVCSSLTLMKESAWQNSCRKGALLSLNQNGSVNDLKIEYCSHIFMEAPEDGTSLFIGADASADVVYFQSAEQAVSWGTRPIVFQPLAGKVGIGTTSPDHQFEVENTTAGSGAGVNYYAGNFKTTVATYNIQAEGTHGGVTGTAIVSYQNSSSPADGDFAGAYNVDYKDSGGNRVQAGSFGWFVTDVTAGTIDTYFYLRVISNSSAVAGTLSTAGVWTDSSAAVNKEYYGTRQEVWPDGVLESLKTLNVSKYKQANLPDSKIVTETHVSPTAEDFWDTFQIGQDPRREVLNAEGEQILNPSIAPKDLSGVALVAIQELLERVEAAEAKIAVLESA